MARATTATKCEVEITLVLAESEARAIYDVINADTHDAAIARQDSPAIYGVLEELKEALIAS